MFGMGKKVDTDRIIQEVRDGTALLVDVRRNDEWQNGHARGATHLALDKILAGDVPTQDKDTKLYLYCGSGNRSGIAAETLGGKGYDVENIGGLSDWSKGGGDIEQ